MSSGSLQRIGHYRLGKNLGIGSFGKVRRAFAGRRLLPARHRNSRMQPLDISARSRAQWQSISSQATKWL